MSYIYSSDCRLNRAGECLPHGGFNHRPLRELKDECKAAISKEGWLETAAQKEALQEKLAAYLASQPWHILAHLVSEANI